MLFSIPHPENSIVLLLEAKRILKEGSKLGIIHWNYDPATPRGPSRDIRPKLEDSLNLKAAKATEMKVLEVLKEANKNWK